MFSIAFVLPSCSETCKCVPNDIKEFLIKQGVAAKIIGIPLKSTCFDYQRAKEAFNSILQQINTSIDPVIIMRQEIPALLSFMLGVGEIKSLPLMGRLRILVKDNNFFRLIDPRINFLP